MHGSTRVRPPRRTGINLEAVTQRQQLRGIDLGSFRLGSPTANTRTNVKHTIKHRHISCSDGCGAVGCPGGWLMTQH